jgi:quercetin dioxygenase-like cupin family protein
MKRPWAETPSATVAATRPKELAVSANEAASDNTPPTSGVWDADFVSPGTPEGFSVRTTYPTNPEGVEVMLETWEPGSEEPPHSHPGDDMTVVVEGKMTVQFYRREAGSLVPEGDRTVLGRGDVGYISAGRVHDARYTDACRLVYVHNGAFAFLPADADAG